MTLFIADMSDFQGSVDWAAYKSAAGRLGAIIKVSEGLTLTADTFEPNREGMTGLVFRGLYHLGHQPNDPAAEANRFCDLVKTLRPGEFPVLDAEDTASGIGPDANWCLAFASVVTRRLGAKPALYFSESFFNERLGSDHRLAQEFRFFWVAAYRQDPPPDIPGMKLWQSTDGKDGRIRDVPGIPAGTRCDDSEFEGTREELVALAAPDPGPHGPGVVGDLSELAMSNINVEPGQEQSITLPATGTRFGITMVSVTLTAGPEGADCRAVLGPNWTGFDPAHPENLHLNPGERRFVDLDGNETVLQIKNNSATQSIGVLVEAR